MQTPYKLMLPLLLLAGCQSPLGSSVITQTVTATGNDSSQSRTVVSAYLPGFKSGQKWVYAVSTGTSSGTSSEEVSYEVTSVGSGTVVQKVSVRSATSQSESTVTLNAYGVPLASNRTQLSQHLSFGGGFNGPRTEVNQSVDLTGVGNVSVNQSATQGGQTVSQSIEPLTFSASGSEKITVPAGSYTAEVYKASSSKTVFPRKQYTIWLVKDIGEVKSTVQDEPAAGVAGSLTVRELMSFTH